MLLGYRSIEKLSHIITGSTGLSPERNKAGVDRIFTKYPCKKESYNACFQDHPDIRNNTLYGSNAYKLHHYTCFKLREMSGIQELSLFCDEFINEISYDEDMAEIIEYLNAAFINDNCEFIQIEEDNRYKVFSIDGSIVSYSCYFKESEKGQHVLIQEHMEKCIKKVTDGDYSGAITNAQSLLEQILVQIRNDIKGTPKKGHGGSLEKLLKSVLKLLNITDGMEAKPKKGYGLLEDGFNDITKGLSLLRHGMSDAHSISHEPNQKDALLAVNTSKTLANFIVEHYFEKFVDAA